MPSGIVQPDAGSLETPCRVRAKVNVGRGGTDDQRQALRLQANALKHNPGDASQEADAQDRRADDRILRPEGRGLEDPTEVGTGSDAGPHFAFGEALPPAAVSPLTGAAPGFRASSIQPA